MIFLPNRLTLTQDTSNPGPDNKMHVMQHHPCEVII
jgi:hypothetical protein